MNVLRQYPQPRLCRTPPTVCLGTTPAQHALARHEAGIPPPGHTAPASPAA